MRSLVEEAADSTQLRALLVLAALLPGALLALKVFTSFGPNLPSPGCERPLESWEGFAPCTLRADGVRRVSR